MNFGSIQRSSQMSFNETPAPANFSASMQAADQPIEVAQNKVFGPLPPGEPRHSSYESYITSLRTKGKVQGFFHNLPPLAPDDADLRMDNYPLKMGTGSDGRIVYFFQFGGDKITLMNFINDVNMAIPPGYSPINIVHPNLPTKEIYPTSGPRRPVRLIRPTQSEGG